MKLSSFGSVYLRFNLSHLFLWLVSILCVSIFTSFAIYMTNYLQIQEHLKTLSFVAIHILEQNLDGHEDDRAKFQIVEQEMEQVFSNETNLGWTIFNPQGIPVINSQKGVLPSSVVVTSDPEIKEVLQTNSGESEKIHKNTKGENTLYLAARIRKGNQIIGVVRLEYSLFPALQAARTSIVLFFVLVGSVTIIIGGLSFLSAKNLTKPIESIAQTTDRIAHGDLDARVSITDKSPEMAFLGQAFNQMAERLQIHVAELRSFVANASHELRTPLTVIKLRIEALRNGAIDEPEVANRFLAEVEGEVDRLSTMVGDMLDLSRIESGLSTSQRTRVDMNNIVCDVRDTMKVRAERANIKIHCEVEEGLPPVKGAEDQLRRMLYNLVDNAIKYTTHGGNVYLTLQAGEHAGTILITIKDNGFGISPEQLPHIFERFFRVEATRPRYGPPQGSGLGLSIAKSIVDSHDGKIWATSEISKGTTFYIELPVMKV